MKVKLKVYKHARFELLLAALLLLVFTRYAYQIEIPKIVLTAVVALIALLGDRDEILAIAMCCIPLHESVDLFYSIVACMAVYIIKNPKRIRIYPAVVLVLGMIIWEALHCFASDFSFRLFLVSIIPFIFIAVILCADIGDIDYGFIVRVMSVGTIWTCWTLLVKLIVMANFNIAIAIAGLQRLGVLAEEEAVTGGAINPNTLGIICVLCISALLQLRSAQKNKTGDVFLMVFMLVFGALTSSRTFFVCLCFMIVLTMMGQKGTLKSKLKFFAIMVIFVVIALLLLWWLFPDLMEYYVGRFFEEDITTGRDTLMVVYHKFIVDNPKVMFFGIGLNDYMDNKLVTAYKVSNNCPHNSIQEIIIAWGIPGLIMFVFLCLMIVKRSHRYCRRHILLNYIPLLVILLKSMAGQFLTSGYTMLALSFAYLSLCQDFTLSNAKAELNQTDLNIGNSLSE